MTKYRRCRRRNGIVLRELVLLVAFPSILVALLLPGVQAVREAARRTQCNNNLRQLSLGCLNYESSFRSFPSGCQPGASGGSELFGWGASLAPFIEIPFEFDRFSALDALTPVNIAMERENVGYSTLLCPSDTKWPLFNYGRTFTSSDGRFVDLSSNYVGSNSSGSLVAIRRSEFMPNGANGIFSFNQNSHGGGVSFKQLTDGSSNTLLLGERAGFRSKSKFWGTNHQPNAACAFFCRSDREDSQHGLSDVLASGHVKINYQGNEANELLFKSRVRQGFSSNHPAGINVTMADGSTRFITEQIDADINSITHLVVSPDRVDSVFERLICIDDGQELSDDDF